jgi:hypothetical protein
MRAARDRTRSSGRLAPLDRDNSFALRISFAAAQPRYEIEHTVGWREPQSLQQGAGRYQLVMAARNAPCLHEIARAKVFDTSGVKGHHRLRRLLIVLSIE